MTSVVVAVAHGPGLVQPEPPTIHSYQDLLEEAGARTIEPHRHLRHQQHRQDEEEATSATTMSSARFRVCRPAVAGSRRV